MRRLSVPIAALACAACGSIPLAERGERLGSPDSAPLDEVPVCGYEISLEVGGQGDSQWTLEGELLAATPDAVTVATERGAVAVPTGSVRSAEVRVLPSLSGPVGAWTAAGSASTLTHGFILVGTLPMWLTAGISSAAGPEARGWRTSAPFDAGLVSQYARFPQGLPTGWPPEAAAVRPCSGAVSR